jgi:hypothetical protein
VTIELGPDEVSRLSESPSGQETEAAPETTPADIQIEENAPADSETIETAEASPSQPRETGAAENAGRTPRAGSFDSWGAEPEASAGETSGPVSREGGIGPMLFAGVAGGVIALVLAGGLQWSGLVPAPGGAGKDAASQSLRSDVDALRQRVASFDQGAMNAATINDALSPVNKRVDQLTADLSQLKSDVADARSAPAAGSADPAQLKALEDRLTKVEQALAATNAAASTQSVDALGQKVNALGQAAASKDDALQKLRESVATLDKKVAEQASEPKATTAVAASALKSAIDGGGAFSTELDLFAAVAPGSPELTELRQLAARGVPTRARLASEVGEVADRMLDATTQAAASDAGVLDRLVASARSLVRVRPVGKVEGDSTPARIARFQNAVTGGDLAKAAAEYDALPEKARTAGAGFIGDLRARLKVDELAQKALAGALKTG